MLLRTGKTWIVERWVGRQPTPGEQETMWKEFARHKAMHLKSRDAIRRSA